MNHGKTSLLSSAWPVLALALVLCLAMLKLITLRYWVHWDMLTFEFPFYLYASDVFRSGEIPLWNPFQDCGTLLYSDLQSHTWYPLNHIFIWTTGFNFYALQYMLILHLFLAGCGMYLLSRRLSVSAPSSLLSGIAYMLCGYFASHAEHQPALTVLVWTPWIVASLEGMIVTGKRRYFFLLVLISSTLLFVGYPVNVLGAILYCTFYVLYRFLDMYRQDAQPGRIYKGLFWILISGFFIIGITSLLFIPALSDARIWGSRLGGMSFEEAMSSNAFPLPALVTLFLPTVAVSVDSQRQVFASDVSMVNLYFGILPLGLAIYSIIRRTHRDVILFSLLGLGALLFAFGGMGILRPLSYEILPLFDSFRHNALLSGFFNISCCLLAGMGLDGLIKAEGDRKIFRKWLTTALVIDIFLLILVTAWYLRWIKADPEMATAIHTGFLNGLPVQILILFIAIVVLSFSLTTSKLKWWIIGLVALDGSIMFQTNMYSIAEPPDVYMERLVKIQLPSRPREFPMVNNASATREDTWDQMDHFGMVRKVFQTGNHNPFRNYDYVRVLEKGFHEIIAKPPRYFLAQGVYVESDKDRALEIIDNAAAQDAMPIIVERDIQGIERLDSPYLLRKELLTGLPRIIEYKYNSITLDVLAYRKCILGSTETYHPGWKVFINGEEQEVIKLNRVFRAVVIPGPGEYQVQFRFEPAEFKWGASISAISLVALMLFGMVSLWKRRF